MIDNPTKSLSLYPFSSLPNYITLLSLSKKLAHSCILFILALASTARLKIVNIGKKGFISNSGDREMEFDTFEGAENAGSYLIFLGYDMNYLLKRSF